MSESCDIGDIQAQQALIKGDVNPPEPDVQVPIKESNEADQVDGFGYAEGTQKWFVLNQCINGTTIAGLAQRMQEQGWKTAKMQDVYVQISRIRKDMSEAGIRKTIVLRGNVYGIQEIQQAYREDEKKRKSGGASKKYKIGRSNGAHDLIKTLQGQEGIEFKVEIAEEAIEIHISGIVRLERNNESEKAVAPLLLKEQFGIVIEKVI